MIEENGAMFGSFELISEFPAQTGIGLGSPLMQREMTEKERAQNDAFNKEWKRRRRKIRRGRSIAALAEKLICQRADLNSVGAFMVAEQMYNETYNFLKSEELLVEQEPQPLSEEK